MIAFASWVPQPDDPHTETDWTVSLTLRDPQTGGPISKEALAAGGLPSSFATFSPPRRYQTPLLRLIFKTSGMEHPQAVSMDAGDARTGAQVSYDLQDENDGSPARKRSETGCGSIPICSSGTTRRLTCHVRFLTGDPVVSS